MIAVYYDEKDDTWRKADSENKNPKYKWYDYCDKMWANSVTVGSTNRSAYLSADLGTEIRMEDILTMQVWIPRYKYTVWNYNLDGTKTSEPQEIEITFEEEIINSGEISCSDTISGTDGANSETCTLKTNNQTCTDETCNRKTYTHPAFTFGDDELTGFWVGKFELSSDANCTASTYVNIGSGCNLTTIKPLVKPNVTSWRGAMAGTFENNIMTMNDGGNKYGFAETDDTHMIKNMEWGAVAYLSHSKYGTNKEVIKNSNSNYLTGCGPQEEENASSGTICNSYNTNLGKSASTTGNIYGIYDMSGGGFEYTLSNIVYSDGKTMISGYTEASDSHRHSGYTGLIYYSYINSKYNTQYTGKYSYPADKYIDKYSYGTSNTQRKRSKLGDSIKEVYKWYVDYYYVADNANAWFSRGGGHNSADISILFGASTNVGSTSANSTTRLVISQTNQK